MIRQILFDTDDELNRKIRVIKEDTVLVSGGQKRSVKVINIFPRGNPNAPRKRILPQYEAWVEIEAK